MAKISRKALDWLALVCIDVTVPAMIAWKHHFGEVTSAVALASGLISLAIGNAVFLGAVHTRNRRSGRGTARGFLVSAAGLAVVSALVTAGAVYLTPEHNEYIDLALSNTPLSQIHPQRKALLVEFMRQRLADSKAYQKEAAELKPFSPPLFSAESFASKSVMQAVSAQLERANAADVSYFDEQKQTMDDFRSKMAKVDPQYLKSFEASDGKQETERRKAFKLQEKWYHATLALYAYASSHSAKIKISKGQLRFTDTAVQSEFAQRMTGAKNLYATWQEEFQRLLKRQEQARREVGLTSDL
jgi:hypothetical protein